MEKRCDNCKYWFKIEGLSPYCKHSEHFGNYTPSFVSCPEHENTPKILVPLGNLKFFLKDQKTGELEVKYVCEDCGKVMVEPYYWQYRMPVVVNGKKSANRPGYYFYCEECSKKDEKNI